MSWLAANDYFEIQAAARDRVDDLADSAVALERGGVVRVSPLRDSDDGHAHLDCPVWSRALGLCLSQAR